MSRLIAWLGRIVFVLGVVVRPGIRSAASRRF